MNLCVDAVVASSQLDALDGTQGLGAMDVVSSSSSSAAAGSSSSSNMFGGSSGGNNNGGGGGDGGNGGEESPEQHATASSSSTFGGGGAQGDGAACAASFRILKAMVSVRKIRQEKCGETGKDTIRMHLFKNNSASSYSLFVFFFFLLFYVSVCVVCLFRMLAVFQCITIIIIHRHRRLRAGWQTLLALALRKPTSSCSTFSATSQAEEPCCTTQL